MLRFLLGFVLLATLFFRIVFVLPIDIAGAMQWPWYCDKPCPQTVQYKNFGSFVPNLLSQHVDMHMACRSFCDARNTMWNQLQIPKGELQELYTSSAKFFTSLVRRNDPIITVTLQYCVLCSFPLQVLYFLSVFLCTSCARFLNKFIMLNIFVLLGLAGYHVYRMWIAARGRVDPLAVLLEIGLEGIITPLLLLLLILSTPKKVARVSKASRKQKQK